MAFDIMGEAEKHPYVTAGVVFVGGLGILYLLGFFGSSSTSSSDTSTNNLAAAYYAAEAATATAGTQLQLATVQATNQTAQVNAQANAATAIATVQANSATAMNAQQVTGATNIAQIQGTTQQTLGNYALLSSNVNANDAANTAVQESNYANEMNTTNANAAVLGSYFANVVPVELQQQQTSIGAIPGIGEVGTASSGYGSPNTWAAAGFTPAQIAQAFGGSGINIAGTG